MLFNFAGLVADIYLAHSANQFRRSSEYVPLYSSGAAAAVLAVLLLSVLGFIGLAALAERTKDPYNGVR